MTQETVLPGSIWRETEFVGGLTGACGPNALAMAESWADQRYTSTLAIYQRMRAAGRCAPNGPATLGGLAEQAAADGCTTEVLAFREPMPEADWRGFVAGQAGERAVVLELANGQALRDSISGQGENARHLAYHFILVAGWHPGGRSERAGRELPAGWWCADGDNFAQGDVLQFYADAVLAEARPCAALAIAGRGLPAGATAAGGATGAAASASAASRSGEPTGFYGLETTAEPQVWRCAETGMHLGDGFREHYAGLRVVGDAACDATNILGLPLSEEYAWEGVTRQDFERGSLIFDPQHAHDPWTIYHAKLTDELRAARAAAADAQARLRRATEALLPLDAALG